MTGSQSNAPAPGSRLGGRVIRLRQPGCRRLGRERGAGFTLVELLAVLAVIGVLASLVVGLTSRASTAGKEARTRAMLGQIEVAIEDYHSTLGFYPPDNPGGGVDPVTGLSLSEPALNPLFYELSGSLAQGDYFVVPSVNERLAAVDVRRFFSLEGFSNVELQGGMPKSFITLKADQYQLVSGPGVGAGLPEVAVLAAPVRWPANLWQQAPTRAPLSGILSADQLRKIAHINPWRYVSTQPTNNVGRYDLWAEYMLGDKRKVVSNWRGDIQER